MLVEANEVGLAVLDKSPLLLQERFVQRFNSIQDWENPNYYLRSSVLQVMTDAEDIDAAPVLFSAFACSESEQICYSMVG